MNVTETRLLSIDSVTMRRSDKDGVKRTILDNVSVDIPASSVVALIGPSGSGKSTLLRLLNRLDDPDSGSIRFSGKEIARCDPLQLRRQIGLVLQKPFMFPGSVVDNLLYPSTTRGQAPPSDTALAEVMKICDVAGEWLDEPARKLSVGQQQRVSIARTLLNQPSVLLLDEPTSSLDPDTADRVLGRLCTYMREKGRALLAVTHDHILARKYADRILNLANGSLGDAGGGE